MFCFWASLLGEDPKELVAKMLTSPDRLKAFRGCDAHKIDAPLTNALYDAI